MDHLLARRCCVEPPPPPWREQVWNGVVAVVTAAANLLGSGFLVVQMHSSPRERNQRRGMIPG